MIMEKYDLQKLQGRLHLKEALEEVRACNEFSERYGLSLSDAEIKELVEGRATALKESGRVEFEGGVLPKLIYAFCDSPYVNCDNYESTLAELQEAFYYFKNESQDSYTDDELIELMEKVFNGRAEGSTEYLIGTSLSTLCRYARMESDPYDDEEDEEGIVRLDFNPYEEEEDDLY